MQEIKSFEYIGKCDISNGNGMSRYKFNVDNQPMYFFEESYDIIDDDIMFLNIISGVNGIPIFEIDTFPKFETSKVIPWKFLRRLEFVIIQSS